MTERKDSRNLKQELVKVASTCHNDEQSISFQNACTFVLPCLSLYPASLKVQLNAEEKIVSKRWTNTTP